MPIIVDGVTIQDCAGVSCDNTNMKLVDADNTRVYTESCYSSGSKEWSVAGDYSWTVPSGVYNVILCMIGGGGAGAKCNDGGQAGGGEAGTIANDSTVAVSPGQVIEITIGAGGDVVTSVSHGEAGEQTNFGVYTAGGGRGGRDDASYAEYYRGDSGSIETCYGTYWHGVRLDGWGSVYWGGEAGLGNGGDAIPEGSGGESNGIRGAGGAGGRAGYTGGNGGDGFIKITW